MKGTSKAKETPNSLVDRAYELIKQKIISIEYAPGQTLNQQAISEDIGLGRTPVHHALHRLSRDHLIEIVPRKSVIVRPLSLDEAAQIIELRLLNEPYASELAARYARRSDIEEAKSILDKAAEEIAGARDIRKLLFIDREFHAWIVRTAQNQILSEVLMHIHDRLARFGFVSLRQGEHANAVYSEHMEILDAIASKDQNRAARATRAHIESFRNTILSVV